MKAPDPAPAGILARRLPPNLAATLGDALRRPGLSMLLALVVGLAAGAGTAVGGPVPVGIVVAGGIATWVTVRMPGVLLGAYLLIPFYKGAVQPYLPIDVTLLLAVLNTLQIAAALQHPEARRLSRAGLALWVALACLVLAGVAYAADQDLALGRAVNYWALVFIPLLAAGLRVASRPAYVRQLLWTCFAMSALTVVLGVTGLFGPERLVVLEMNTIQTARAALLVPLIGITFVMRQRSVPMRLVAWALIPPSVLVALASGSRGPVLVLAVLGVLVLVRRALAGHGDDRRMAVVVVGLAAVSIGIVSLAAPDLPAASAQRIGSLGAILERGIAGAGESRLGLYGLAVDLFAGRPLLGGGTAAFEAVSPRYLGPAEAAAYPHNAVLQFAAEYGLAGLALFVGIVAVALGRPRGPEPAWSAVGLAVGFFLLNAMVSGNILEDRTLWGLVLLLVLAPAPSPARAPGEPAATAARAQSGRRVPGATGSRSSTMATLTRRPPSPAEARP